MAKLTEEQIDQYWQQLIWDANEQGIDITPMIEKSLLCRDYKDKLIAMLNSRR